ncbi:MAG: FAD-binding protein, partial [Raoultibacter sp.]
SNSNGDAYFKGTKGVILCSGGFGMNPDMLKKYIPTAYKTAVHGGPMPYNTGECTRMALGVGADMAGIDSWNCWESELDNGTGEWQYFWGARQIAQLPWLSIDARGKRCNFYKWLRTDAYQSELPFAQDGTDVARMAVQVSRIGNRAYVIFDGKFENYMWDIAAPPLWERRPTSADDPIPEQDLFDPDWRVQFEQALEDGRFKQAGTLEELAEQLGLDPKILKDSVDQWNENCANGVDTGTIYPLAQKFLNPVVEPPFYGAKVGGYLGKTLCGVRVDENLHVLNDEGKVIPGLYANFTAAGGAAGESTFGSSILTTSFLGGNLLTWSTGYQATLSALSD